MSMSRGVNQENYKKGQDPAQHKFSVNIFHCTKRKQKWGKQNHYLCDFRR